MLDETLLDLIAFLKSEREFTYVHDCGDHWEHRIRIGRIQPARDDGRNQYFVSGTGRCPLEDIGCAWGHHEFMRAFDDPNSDYREHLPDLYKDGMTWDPEDADLDARRAGLAPFTEWGFRACTAGMSFLGRRRNLDCDEWFQGKAEPQ